MWVTEPACPIAVLRLRIYSLWTMQRRTRHIWVALLLLQSAVLAPVASLGSSVCLASAQASEPCESCPDVDCPAGACVALCPSVALPTTTLRIAPVQTSTRVELSAPLSMTSRVEAPLHPPPIL